MGRQRRRAECSSFVPDNTCLHHDAPRRAEQPTGAERKPAAAKRRAAISRGTPASRRLTRGVPGLLCRPQHLVNEALLLRRAGIADAPRPNTQVAIAHAHGASKRLKARTVPKTPLIAFVKTLGAARDPTDRHARTQAMPMACGSTGEPLLSRLPNRAGKVNSFPRFSSTLRTPTMTDSLHQQRATSSQPRTPRAFTRRGPCVPSRSALGPSHALHQVRKQGCPSSPALSS
ncbi:hypothetical protein ACVIU4_001235 [Bradyrhizobium barranii subsp. barranii]